MAKPHTECLRRAALEHLERSGRAFERISHRGYLYRLDDGRTFRLVTNLKRVLICTTDGTSPVARLYLERADYVLFAAPRAPASFDRIDVYFIPASVVGDYARVDHAAWLKIATTKGGNRTWQQILDEADFLCRGYSVKYEPYRLSGRLTGSTTSDS